MYALTYKKKTNMKKPAASLRKQAKVEENHTIDLEADGEIIRVVKLPLTIKIAAVVEYLIVISGAVLMLTYTWEFSRIKLSVSLD